MAVNTTPRMKITVEVPRDSELPQLGWNQNSNTVINNNPDTPTSDASDMSCVDDLSPEDLQELFDDIQKIEDCDISVVYAHSNCNSRQSVSFPAATPSSPREDSFPSKSTNLQMPPIPGEKGMHESALRCGVLESIAEEVTKVEREMSMTSILLRWHSAIYRRTNKFWLSNIGCRCRFADMYTVSVGQICFLIWCFALFGLCIYLVGGSYFNRWSNTLPFVGGITIHSGLITGMFYLMVILLSSRYPFYWKWGLFMIGFDRQMLYHQKCAQMAAVCCVLHIIDHREVLMTWKAVTGWICYGSALCMLFLGNEYFRRKHYNGLFIRFHWLFIIMFLEGGWMHNAILIQYGTCFIVIDALLRVIDHRCRSSKITGIRLLDFDRIIKLDFEKRHFRYRAGQYVFIRVPAVGLLEFHPFSISSYPGSGSTFSVHIKSSVASANGWTSRLMKFMKEHENNPEHYKDISVQIEGPFGELTLRKELSRYEHVVFIGGGIGITPLDSLYNQFVTDLFDNNIRRTAKTRKIDFIFTTRSRSLITEFASRNKAWEYYAKNKMDDASPDTEFNGDTFFAGMTNLALPSKPNSLTVQKSDISWTGDTPHITERIEHSRKITNSMILGELDKKVGDNKPRHMVFSSSRTSIGCTTDFDTEKNPDTKRAYARDLAVDSLEITNSTHITRIKSDSLKRQYKQTYPFINFQRPNIRGIIYKAASDTRSKDICILTSGPKGMINECKRWAAEIGVDVHSEVFDW